MKEKLSLTYLKDMVESGKDLNELLSFVEEVESNSYLYPLIEKPIRIMILTLKPIFGILILLKLNWTVL